MGISEEKREYNKLYSREYVKRPKVREQKRIYDKSYRIKIRSSIFEFFNNKCVNCGFNDIRALQIDHINGGGSKERKLIGANSTFYKQVFESLTNKENKYQLLCANCNWIKRHDNNELKK